jgi:methylthioribose-1-phosphate isomerase
VSVTQLGLEGIFEEQVIPLPMRRAGMAEWHGDHVRILDRRDLPLKESYVNCYAAADVARAIKDMVIQGAYSISIAAGYGLALSAPENSDASSLRSLEAEAEQLITTRPTGLALNRMMLACLKAAHEAVTCGDNIREAMLALVDRGAATLARQGYETGKNACDLIADGATILTHCFPDRSFVYLLLETARRNKSINVICSETRPYLQGARLSALCSHHIGFSTRVITDGMGGFLMRDGQIDVFITAADRVCMDGTVCNKIGTYQYALAAKANNLPYYTLRQSGPDRESKTEADIKVEYRDGEEIVHFAGVRTAPVGVEGLYPAFDIVPPELVSRIITDRGAYSASGIKEYIHTPSIVRDTVV